MLVFLQPQLGMRKYNISSHASFYVVGISYKKADAELRGKFSLTDQQLNQLILQAKQEGVEGLLTIATCNRTELLVLHNILINL